MTKIMVWIVFVVGIGLVVAAIWATLKKLAGGSGTIKLPGGLEVTWHGAALSFLVFGAIFMLGSVTWSIRIDEIERARIEGLARDAAASLESAVSEGGSEYAPQSVEAARVAKARLDRSLERQTEQFTLFRAYDQILPVARAADETAKAAVTTTASRKEVARQDARQAIEETKARLRTVSQRVAHAPGLSGPTFSMATVTGELGEVRASLDDAESAYEAGDYLQAKSKAATARERLRQAPVVRNHPELAEPSPQ